MAAPILPDLPADPLSAPADRARCGAGPAGPGLYVHVPFCKRRCGYCDFYVEVRGEAVRRRAVEGILREADLRGPSWEHGAIDNVFVGGGTPSLLGPDLLSRLLRGLRDRLPIARGAEITIEANPESAEAALLDAALAGGANRLSLGVQSFEDDQLVALGRLHDAAGARDAVARARAAGFASLNLDLIYGLPGEGAEEAWDRTLGTAIGLGPDHLSGYLLTLEPHVPLGRAEAAGRVHLPDDAAGRRAYDTARRRLAGAGFEQIEISNWARPGFACRHNVNVWRGGAYLGLGPGAHGNHGGVRRANRPDLAGYLEAVEGGREPPAEERSISAAERIEEMIFLRLRLREGIAWEALCGTLGADGAARLRERARPLAREGLIEVTEDRLRIAEEGLFVSNAIVADLLEAIA